MAAFVLSDATTAAMEAWARSLMPAGEYLRTEIVPTDFRPSFDGGHEDIGRFWLDSYATAAYPATEWTERPEADSRFDGGFRWNSTYTLREQVGGTPLLLRTLGGWHGPHGSDMEWYTSASNTWTLYLPDPELELVAAREKRERREFAAGVRRMLTEAGVPKAVVSPLFKAAGVSRAVRANDLARAAVAALGKEEAAKLLVGVLFAPYGRERQLARLADQSVEWHAHSAGQLNAELAGAVVILQDGQPASRPKVAATRVHIPREYRSPAPATPEPPTFTELEEGLTALRQRQEARHAPRTTPSRSRRPRSGRNGWQSATTGE